MTGAPRDAAQAAAGTAHLSIGQCASLACLWEVSAPKPGNVHRGADFDDGRAVFGDQLVATVQVIAAFEEDAGFSAGSERYFQAAALTLVVGQRHRVGGGGAGALVEDEAGAANTPWPPLFRGGTRLRRLNRSSLP